MSGEGYLSTTESMVVSPTRSDARVTFGQHTSVAASDTVVTGLTTVVGALACLDDDLTVANTQWVSASIGDQAGTPAAGSILIKGWIPTANDNATPKAAATFGKKINWVAWGY